MADGWSHEQDEAFKMIKDALVSDNVLTHYNVNDPVEVYSDASQDGLGACIMQRGKPVAYASRSLTKTEQYYAPIEKELLGGVFALCSHCSVLYSAERELCAK